MTDLMNLKSLLNYLKEQLLFHAWILEIKDERKTTPYHKYKFPPPQNKIPLRDSNNGQRR